MLKLFGPFQQLLPFSNLNDRGPLSNETIEVIVNGGIVTNGGKILAVGKFEDLYREYKDQVEIFEIEEHQVLIPGLVDSQTKICFSDQYRPDYSINSNGHNSTVITPLRNSIEHTDIQELEKCTLRRIKNHVHNGITTLEIQNGHGATQNEEHTILKAISNCSHLTSASLIPTYLSSFPSPNESNGSALNEILNPTHIEEKYIRRINFDLNKNFEKQMASNYLHEIEGKNYDVCLKSSSLTEDVFEFISKAKAVSISDLSETDLNNLKKLASFNISVIVNPGESLYMGKEFAPARKILDSGNALAVSSNWNPLTAPKGDLLSDSCILSNYEKLTDAELFSAITFRSAQALNLHDRGILEPGKKADFIGFPCSDYRDIRYNQGNLKSNMIWIDGEFVSSSN